MTRWRRWTIHLWKKGKQGHIHDRPSHVPLGRSIDAKTARWAKESQIFQKWCLVRGGPFSRGWQQKMAPYDAVQDQGHISYSRPFWSPICIKFSVFVLVKSFMWLSNNPSRHPKKAGLQEQVKIQKKKYKIGKYGKKSQIRATQILKQQLVTYVIDRKSMFWSEFFHKTIHVHHSFMQKIFSTVIVADLLPKKDNMSKLPHDK